MGRTDSVRKSGTTEGRQPRAAACRASRPAAVAAPLQTIESETLMPDQSEHERRGFTYRPEKVPEDFFVTEVFGYPPEADTDAARDARERCWCPFQNRPCTKLRTAAGTGVCSLRYKAKGFPRENIWAICAKRLTGGPFEHAKAVQFASRAEAAELVTEVKINNPDMSFDGVIYLIGEGDDPEVEFAGIEAQTIDTRGGAVKPIWQAYVDGEPQRWRDYYEEGKVRPGVNTTNVWKRMLPQAMNKGRMFRDWDSALLVILQATLLTFIRRRMPFTGLGPQDHDLAEIIWLSWEYTGAIDPQTGARQTAIGEPVRTTLEEIEQAFVTVHAAQRLAFIETFLKKARRDSPRTEAARRRVRRRAREVDQQIVEVDPDKETPPANDG